MSLLKPVLVTVNGTGEPDPFGPGFSGDIGRAFADNPWARVADLIDGVEHSSSPVFWQPTGYPAGVFPMNPSVQAGVTEVRRLVLLQHTPGYPLFMSGYSQGAIVVGQVFLQDFWHPNGQFHTRLPDLARGGIINFGDPYRAPGVANGNKTFGFPMPKTLDGVSTGGIGGPLDLTPDETPDWYLSCALDGDLYACAPVGDDPWKHEASAGKVETSIYNLVESGSPKDFLKIALDLGAPIGMVEAIFNGMKFASQGTNAPHWQYGPFVGPAINWILSRI